ncbi:MAG: MmcQ/YjbR family DNA-binding protein [Bacteroidetes bacterium]|nr:MmcQ/YjbR family DNA-binding protein [Bacteroidota bacterium]
MDPEWLLSYCLSKEGVEETFPFDQHILVFKVLGKIFALTDVRDFSSINLKCHPEKAIQLREEFPAVQPGFHMNKTHWNTVHLDGSISLDQLKEWLDDSYDLVLGSVPKKTRKEAGL